MNATESYIRAIDEKSYLGGCTLSEALAKYCSRESLELYRHQVNKRPEAGKGYDTHTLLGAMQSIGDSFQNARIHEQKTNAAIDNLYREVRLLTQWGDLIPYGYRLPRQLSDLPIAIPIEMFLSGQVNWATSELSYRDFAFTGIRLIEPLKEIPLKESSATIIDMEQESFKEKALENIPAKAHSTIISPRDVPLGESFKGSFTELDPDLHIDEKKAATYLGISPRTLQGYRVKGGGPEFIKISHKVVRYKIADLIKWAGSRKRKNTSA